MLGIVTHAVFRIAVSHSALELAQNVLGLFHEVDGAVGILVGFRHLGSRIAQAHHTRTDLGNVRLGHLEDVAIDAVEALDDVAAELDMLLLILAHGDIVGLIE